MDQKLHIEWWHFKKEYYYCG